MHIKTANGWKPLQVRDLVHVPFAPEIYRGRLPSPEAIRFCAQQQREHDEWAERRAYLTSEVE